MTATRASLMTLGESLQDIGKILHPLDWEILAVYPDLGEGRSLILALDLYAARWWVGWIDHTKRARGEQMLDDFSESRRARKMFASLVVESL